MKFMGWIGVMLALLGCGNPVDTTHLEKDLLHLETKIPLTGVSGRIDHLAYDSVGRRVFVAALGNGTVEVVDLSSGRRLYSITGLREPQGVVYVSSRLVVADGGSGDCIVYDGGRYLELGRVALGDDADNVRYDGARVYVGYGSGGIAVIDPLAIRKVGDLPLKGHPESFQLDDSGRVWINIPDEGEVVTADMRTLRITGQWKNRGGAANFPMALDKARLFVGYRHPAQVRVLDNRTGSMGASLPCVGDADDVFYDNGVLFVSGGEGYLDVFRGDTLVNHIPTRRGARTCLWLPGERKLILAVPARGGEEAALWVYGM